MILVNVMDCPERLISNRTKAN